jgi:hypothetical protein
MEVGQVERTSDVVTRHLKAARLHPMAAERHANAAAGWVERRDEEQADLERRNALLEQQAAQLECDRAAFVAARRR